MADRIARMLESGKNVQRRAAGAICAEDAGAAGAGGGVRRGSQRAFGFALIALGVLVVAVAICASFFAMNASTAEQGAESVRQAVLSAAMQCCAVEGSYPSTIEHLEEHYGLSVNHDDYAIMYEAFASNVVPSVTVVPR